MTDPIAYENGEDHQLDVYEVLALVNEDAFAGVEKAADDAVGDLGFDWDGWAEDTSVYYRTDDNLDADAPDDHPDDDDFTFLPDDYDRLEV
jgi:hypothetical protein